MNFDIPPKQGYAIGLRNNYSKGCSEIADMRWLSKKKIVFAAEMNVYKIAISREGGGGGLGKVKVMVSFLASSE